MDADLITTFNRLAEINITRWLVINDKTAEIHGCGMRPRVLDYILCLRVTQNRSQRTNTQYTASTQSPYLQEKPRKYLRRYCWKTYYER